MRAVHPQAAAALHVERTRELELGRIERLDPREAWKNEALDFTPWLRDNIDILGEALGLEIDPSMENEVPVGSFSADLLGTDLSSGRAILVENQLEPTDHSHLGQLITYASGLDAGVIVWVARKVRDEHRQALMWLNEKTLSDISFFGVELELIRIGASAVAPNLKVMVAPSAWQKSATAVRTGQVSNRQQKYREFWSGLIAGIRARDPKFTWSDPEKAPRQNWCSFSAGRHGFQNNAAFGWEDTVPTVRVELYIDVGERDANKRAFDALEAEKAAIEAEFGEQLIWTRRDDIRASRVFVSCPGSIEDEAQALDGHRAWLIDRLFRIREVFGPRIRSLSFDEPPGL